MRLYVGNLSPAVNEAQLTELASPFGSVVSTLVITDRSSGLSKGFGFVEYGTDEEARAAIAGLNGRDVEGKPLNVSEAKPRT